MDFPPGWGNRTVADRAFAGAGLDRRVPFEVAEFTSAAALVRNGLGIAFVPESAADLTGLARDRPGRPGPGLAASRWPPRPPGGCPRRPGRSWPSSSLIAPGDHQAMTDFYHRHGMSLAAACGQLRLERRRPAVLAGPHHTLEH